MGGTSIIFYSTLKRKEGRKGRKVYFKYFKYKMKNLRLELRFRLRFRLIHGKGTDMTWRQTLKMVLKW